MEIFLVATYYLFVISNLKSIIQPFQIDKGWMEDQSRSLFSRLINLNIQFSTFLGTGLILNFQFYQHLTKKLDSFLQEICVSVQSHLDKVLPKCYSWISQLVSPFWLPNLIEAQDGFFYHLSYTTL
jgi:hypothetical protein